MMDNEAIFNLKQLYENLITKIELIAKENLPKPFLNFLEEYLIFLNFHMVIRP